MSGMRDRRKEGEREEFWLYLKQQCTCTINSPCLNITYERFHGYLSNNVSIWPLECRKNVWRRHVCLVIGHSLPYIQKLAAWTAVFFHGGSICWMNSRKARKPLEALQEAMGWALNTDLKPLCSVQLFKKMLMKRCSITLSKSAFNSYTHHLNSFLQIITKAYTLETNKNRLHYTFVSYSSSDLRKH